MKISFQGTPLTKLQKLANSSLLHPKRLELWRFIMDEDEITMFFGDGSVRHIKKEQFEASFNRAMYVSFGRYVTIKTIDGNKFSFLERLVKYKPGEFDNIIQICGAEESKASDIAMTLLDVMKQVKRR